MITVWRVIKRICMLIFDLVSKAGLSLTQTAREDRALNKYTEIYNYYRRFPNVKLNGIYITTKAVYEYKKCFFSVWLISIVAAFLSGAWKYFIQFFIAILQFFSDGSMAIDIFQTNVLFSSIVFVVICGIIAIFLYWYIRGMRDMYRDLLIMEECLKRPEENE